MAYDYKTLITPLHQQPRFQAVVDALAGALGQVTDTTLALPSYFDIDQAEGAQLDVLGEWVGAGRSVRAPIDNNFFSLDTAGKGFDEGYWKAAFLPVEGVAFLDDLSYRAALRFKILQNHWHGNMIAFNRLWITLEGATPNLIVVYDNQDMSMNVNVYGPPVSNFLQLYIQQQGLIPKPVGVRIASYTFTVSPVFGADEDSLSISGPDFGFLI